MRPRGIVVFLALSPLLCAPARAQTSLTAGDSTPLAAVKAALHALKGLPGGPTEKSRALLATLTKSAAQLQLKGEPAAALGRLKEAAEEKTSPDALANVRKRGDEFLAALAAPTPAPNAGAVPNAVPPKNVAVALPEGNANRALALLNGSLGSNGETGALAPAGNARGVTGFPVGVITTSPQIGPAVRDLGIAVPAAGGAPAHPAPLFHDAEFSMPAYRVAAVNALQHIENYIAAKPPGMPSLAPVAAASRNIAYEMDALVRSTNRAVAAAAPSAKPALSKAVTVVPPAKFVPKTLAELPAPHFVVGTTGGSTSGKYSTATGRLEVGAASVNVTAGNIGRADIRYGLNTGDLKIWASHRPAGDLLRAKSGFGVSAVLDPVTNTELTGSVTVADTRKGPNTTFMLGISGALASLAP